MALNKFLLKKYRVRFADCDPFGHLNNARYLEYFLNAREDHLIENYDLDLSKWAEEHGNNWVIKSHQLQFLRPARANEWVYISSGVIQYGPSDITVEFGMWDENQKKLKAMMWTSFQYISLATQRSAVHEESLNQLIHQIILEAPQSDFAKRPMEMQSLFRA
ncbi:MAG: acyl-CoA thioesterase [Bacteroidota bacterium]|nr:acyl-CoA thioesterase [Bacteroidota bacterium]MDX5430310.1 acyl-CoA thioesterase [Bacteroidota bacterium]MDX5469071.1 acyl-CoA thioesterase [Bacteroidota bacterium]